MTATLGTRLNGILTNCPPAQILGVGLAAVFTYTLCGSMGLSYGAALSAVFIAGVFFSPGLSFVPTGATAPILIVVGVMMSGSLKDIDWEDIEEALSSFVTVLGMPVFYYIIDGIAFGFITFFIVKLAKDKFKEIHPIMYVVVLLFIVKYVITALGY